jgi:hypothetical protein
VRVWVGEGEVKDCGIGEGRFDGVMAPALNYELYYYERSCTTLADIFPYRDFSRCSLYALPISPKGSANGEVGARSTLSCVLMSLKTGQSSARARSAAITSSLPA